MEKVEGEKRSWERVVERERKQGGRGKRGGTGGRMGREGHEEEMVRKQEVHSGCGRREAFMCHKPDSSYLNLRVFFISIGTQSYTVGAVQGQVHHLGTSQAWGAALRSQKPSTRLVLSSPLAEGVYVSDSEQRKSASRDMAPPGWGQPNTCMSRPPEGPAQQCSPLGAPPAIPGVAKGQRPPQHCGCPVWQLS